MEKNRILLAAVLIFTVIWNKIPFEIAVVSASESYTVLCEIPQNETTEAATETSESETGDEIKETSQTTEPEIENETKEMNSTQTETEEEIETQKTKTVDRAAEQDNLDLSTVASAGAGAAVHAAGSRDRYFCQLRYGVAGEIHLCAAGPDYAGCGKYMARGGWEHFRCRLLRLCKTGG